MRARAVAAAQRWARRGGARPPDEEEGELVAAVPEPFGAERPRDLDVELVAALVPMFVGSRP